MKHFFYIKKATHVYLIKESENIYVAGTMGAGRMDV
jgi:hypothetical protein